MPAYKSDRGTWYASFYYADWTGTRRRKKKEGFPTKREAQAWERDFLSKARGDCTMTFGNLRDLYLEDARARLKPTTLETKRHILDSRILPTFKEVRLCDITPAMVRTWQNDLLTDPAEYSQTYLRTVHTQLSAILNFACKYHGLHTNAARTCGSIGRKKREHDAMKIWTVEQYQAFAAALEEDPSAHVAFQLLYWTGMRSGELLALSLDDFDMDAGTVRITKNFARTGGRDLILEPKTPKSRRTITVPAFVLEEVTTYADRLYDYEADQRLFSFGKTWLYRLMTNGATASGVPTIRVHDVRHSHASLLIQLGYSPLLISERLGHESPTTTMDIYAHLWPDAHAEVAERLQSVALKGAKKRANAA